MRGIAGPTTRLLAGLALLTLVGGCGGEPAATETNAAVHPPVATATPAAANRTVDAPLSAGVLRDLLTLRRVTAPFRDFGTAKAAGWATEITACMADPALGGMGFHFGDTDLIDGSVQVDQPELLLYEPEPGGRLRLVAVEYIIPVDQWTSPKPPRLFERDFHVVEAFQVWALHVWLWKANPNGLFEDWNPRVSCDHTTDVAAMAHH